MIMNSHIITTDFLLLSDVTKMKAVIFLHFLSWMKDSLSPGVIFRRFCLLQNKFPLMLWKD